MNDLVYHVAAVSFGRIRFKGLVEEPTVPNRTTMVTFSLTDPDRAGALLRILTASSSYGPAARCAIEAGFSYKSANCGEPQILSLCRPGDLWATVIYTRDHPAVVSGGYSDVAKTLRQLCTEGRLRSTTFLPPETIFARTVITNASVLV